MKIEGDAKRVTVYMGESDRWHHQPLHTALVEMLRREGAAGATVFKGVEGFGKNSRIHTASILRLSADLPIVLVWVDTPERVDALLPGIDEMLCGGLVVVEDVHVRTYCDSNGG
ncbi:MAG TPA: DUF190 domain-containing protein [Coriobacteriia bacterium]|nr:DUF190 domain-containing protein [Coriobacteriia bacterium]